MMTASMGRQLLAVLLPIVAAVVPPPARAAAAPRVYTLIAGEEHDYTVEPGANVWAITGRFTMTAAFLKALNPLPNPNLLQPGMRLRVSDRHVVPARGRDGIVIDLADRTLFWFERGRLKTRFPVGVGRIDWATPPGRYRIVGRRENPVWHVPPSIQDEMRAQGLEVVKSVPSGPDNPLGQYWIQLSVPGYGLHGTNAPASVGKVATHGCMRLLPEHVELLYREARNGTPVEIIYEPVKLARDGAGHVFLEVHRDVYHGNRVDAEDIAARIAQAGLVDTVDWTRVAQTVAHVWGTPEDVTGPSNAPGPPSVVPAAQR